MKSSNLCLFFFLASFVSQAVTPSTASDKENLWSVPIARSSPGTPSVNPDTNTTLVQGKTSNFRLVENYSAEARPESIPAQPLAQNTRENVVFSVPSVSAPTTPPETDPADKKLEINLRELKVLKRAAQAAGGELKVSVVPVGVTADDLFLRASETGFFDLSQKNDGQILRISSKEKDPYSENLKKEVVALELRRAQLMKDVNALESLIEQNQTIISKPNKQKIVATANTAIERLSRTDEVIEVTLSPEP